MSKEDDRQPRLSLGGNTYSWEELNTIEEAKRRKAEEAKWTISLRNIRRNSLPESSDKDKIAEVVENRKAQTLQVTENKETLNQNPEPNADQDTAIPLEDILQPGDKKGKRDLDRDLTEDEHNLIEQYESDVRFLETNINRAKVGANKFDAVKARFLVWIDRAGRIKGENTTLKQQIIELKEEKALLQREILETRDRAIKAETICEQSMKAKDKAEQDLKKHEENSRRFIIEIQNKRVEILAAEQQLKQLESQNKTLNEEIKNKSTIMENIGKENDKLIRLIEQLKDYVEDISKNQPNNVTSEPREVQEKQSFADIIKKTENTGQDAGN